jgi:hypothetical protein
MPESDDKAVERESVPPKFVGSSWAELVGAAGANDAKIDFDTDLVTVGDMRGLLEEATGRSRWLASHRAQSRLLK